MNWKLALIAIAVFASACTGNNASGAKAAGAGLKALKENLIQQISNDPSLSNVLEVDKTKWIHVSPGNTPLCQKLTRGFYDDGYVHCMNGYEAEVEKLSNGTINIVQVQNPPTR